MTGPDRPSFTLEITEDSREGIVIRLKQAGYRPDVLAGIPKDVLRRARPWIWNSYERKVLRKARSMTWQTYRIVRDTLLLDRAKMIMASRPQAKGPARLSWLERRRMQRAHTTKLQEMSDTARITRNLSVSLPNQAFERDDGSSKPKTEPTLTELMRDQSGTALSSPKPRPPRSRSR